MEKKIRLSNQNTDIMIFKCNPCALEVLPVTALHHLMWDMKEIKQINTIHSQREEKKGKSSVRLLSYHGHTALQLFCLLQEVSHCLERNEGESRDMKGSAERLFFQTQRGVVSRSPPTTDLAWPMSPVSWLLACAPRGDLRAGLSTRLTV